jgi:hypothetical protein
VLSLFLPKYLGSKHDMTFLHPPCQEIDEPLENCHKDGELWPWLMVMSGPHNIEKFSKLTYILPCHYDPYHDKITEWLEDSYINKFQNNGKVVLSLFLTKYIRRKNNIFILYMQILHSFILIFDFLCLAGLNMLLWMH